MRSITIQPEGVIFPYELYEDGRVYSYHRKRFLKGGKTKKGYLNVGLANGTIMSTRFYRHRLVATYFIEGGGTDVNHKDGCKSNNLASNLEWSTREANMKHAWDNDLITGHETKRKNNQTYWVGQVVGNRKVIATTDIKNKGGNYKVKVRCTCSNEFLMYYNDFIKGSRKRCIKCKNT